MIRDLRQISLLILNEFNRVNSISPEIMRKTVVMITEGIEVK